MESQAGHSSKQIVRVRVQEFTMPPIRDGLVLGRQSPIGCVAIRKAVSLLVASPFAHIELEDEVVSDILIREAILRRLPRDALVAFVLDRIKPLMGPEEVLHLELKVEVLLEGENQ